MAFSYTIKNNGILSKATGELSGKDILNFNNQIYSNADKIKAINYQLCDLTEVNEVEASTEDIIAIAEQDKAAFNINPDMIIAIVASENLPYGLARMWDAYVDEPHFQTVVFRSIEEATAWINTRVLNAGI